MALTQEEKQIVDNLRGVGKTDSEITRAIANKRAGGTMLDNESESEERKVFKESFGNEFFKGAAKGVGALFSGAGAHKAGPVGAEMLKNAPAFAENIRSAEEALIPTEGAQEAGFATEKAAEFISPFVATRIAGLASRAISLAKAPTIAETGISGLVKRGAEKVAAVVKNPRLALAKQNVSPQLESSAQRLFVEGTERLKDPIATYDKYLSQSKKALTDIKADPAIADVGESIGDAFKGVVSQRRAVGKTMSEELKKVGDIKTDVLPTVDNFVKSLADEGLVYDRVTKGISQTASQTKMGQSDIALLRDFAQQLQSLGSKPTLKELDAFMSRIPNEIQVYKAKNAITGSTNAERIIKGSLAGLREQFDPVKTGNKALEGYSNARKSYAELSDFIEEGTGFLGKLTQTGDFAKDASLAKSAVQSILNQGKKDWLNELEKLTGYPALDDSVLALQAMKDAGDFRGLSLLEELAQNTPASQAGIYQKVIDFALSKVGKAVGGTPEEQTRAFLNALKEGLQKEGL